MLPPPPPHLHLHRRRGRRYLCPELDRQHPPCNHDHSASDADSDSDADTSVGSVILMWTHAYYIFLLCFENCFDV